jgi:tellurite resistance protein
MLVYTRRAGLSFLHRRDVLEVFDQWVRALQHDPTAAAKATFHLLSDCSGSSLAWAVLRAAEHVAAADLRMQDAEVTALRSIRLALGMGLDTFSAPLSA